METATPTSEPGAVGSGGEVASRSEEPRIVPEAAKVDRINSDQIINSLYWEKCKAAEAALPTVLPRVWEYCQKHIAAGRTWRSFYPYKLLELWEILQTEKPRSILELGSGCTTAVFAEYGAKFVTVDESQGFQAAVLRDIGVPIDHAVARKWLKTIEGVQCCGYEGIEVHDVSLNVDLLYVDGPDNRLGDGKLAVCLDACCLKSFPPRLIVFDVRRESATYTRKFYGDRYNWSHSAWQEAGVPWYLSGIRHHTVARRKA